MSTTPWGPPDPQRQQPEPPPPAWAAALRARRPDEPAVPEFGADTAAGRPWKLVVGLGVVAGLGVAVFAIGLPRLAAWQRDRNEAVPLVIEITASSAADPASSAVVTTAPPALEPLTTSSSDERAQVAAFTERITPLGVDALVATAAGRALCASLESSGGDVAAAVAAGSLLANAQSLPEDRLDVVHTAAVEVFCPEWQAVWTDR